MSEERSRPYPTEILKEKYIPVDVFCSTYGVSDDLVRVLLKDRRVSYTEFRSSNTNRRRSVHVNPEEILSYLERVKDQR